MPNKRNKTKTHTRFLQQQQKQPEEKRELEKREENNNDRRKKKYEVKNNRTTKKPAQKIFKKTKRKCVGERIMYRRCRAEIMKVRIKN